MPRREPRGRGTESLIMHLFALYSYLTSICDSFQISAKIECWCRTHWKITMSDVSVIYFVFFVALIPGRRLKVFNEDYGG